MGILVLNMVKDFASKLKTKDQVLIEKYKELHQAPSLKDSLASASSKSVERNFLAPKNHKAILNSHKAEALGSQVITPQNDSLCGNTLCNLIRTASFLGVYLLFH